MDSSALWADADRVLLAAIQDQAPTLPELATAAGFPPRVVKDLVLGYLNTLDVTQYVDHGIRYAITIRGRLRLAALTATEPFNRKAA